MITRSCGCFKDLVVRQGTQFQDTPDEPVFDDGKGRTGTTPPTTTTTTVYPGDSVYKPFFDQQIALFSEAFFGIHPIDPVSIYIEDPGFWGKNLTPDVDFNGVAYGQSGFCGTAITDKTCLQAWHFRSSVGAPIKWTDIMGYGNPVETRTVVSTHRIRKQGPLCLDNADIALIVLDSDLPAWVPRYSIPSLFDIHPEVFGSTGYSIRLDRFKRAHFAKCNTFPNNPCPDSAYKFTGNNTNAAWPPWQALSGGDSSKPTFLLGNDKKLLLCGVHTYVNSDRGFLPRYLTELQDALDANAPGETLSIVDLFDVD